VNLNSGIVGKHGNESLQTESVEKNGLFNNIRQQAKEYSNAVFPDRDKKNETPGLFYAIASSINIFQDRITRSRLAGDPADVLLSPRVAQIGMLEFHRANEAIEEGERSVRRALSDIHELLAHWQP